MSINRKNFLKTLGGVSLGLLAGPLVAGSGYAFGASAASEFALTPNEEKHLGRFYKQLRNAEFPLPEHAISGFRPVRLLKRESRITGYKLEYLSQNGTTVVLAGKKGRYATKCTRNMPKVIG